MWATRFDIVARSGGSRVADVAALPVADAGGAEEVFESGGEGMDEGGDALRGFGGDGALEDVVGEEDGFGGVAELGKQAVGALVSGFGEEDGAQAQAAADGLLDQFDALDGD